MRKRSYRAAKPDRLAAGFFPSPVSVRKDLRQDIKGLVQHSRHAAHNFDHARNYELLIRRHVVGPQGIRLQMNVRDPSGKKDELANQIIQTGWKDWGRKGNPTICGRLSWWGVEKVVATAMAREGGAFIRFHRGPNRGRFGFQVEPIPFDMLDIDLTQALSNGRYIESGIEFNSDGRVLAFMLHNVMPSEGHIPGERKRIRVPADQMIYVMPSEEIGQALGIPRLATALRLMNLSEGFQESAMAAANYGAANMIFFSQEDEAGQITGSSDEDAECPIDQIEGGLAAMLPPGVKPVSHNPNYPEAAVEPFMRYMGTAQAAGLGVAYETLSTDFSRANFSVLRAGKGEERDEWRMLQRDLFEGLHDLVFREVLRFGMLTGQIKLPFSKFDKFNSPIWRPRGWPSVNPKDDAMANKIEVELGIRSRTEIVADRGRDYDDVSSEISDDLKMMGDKEIPIPSLSTSLPKKEGKEADEET